MTARTFRLVFDFREVVRVDAKSMLLKICIFTIALIRSFTLPWSKEPRTTTIAIGLTFRNGIQFKYGRAILRECLPIWLLGLLALNVKATGKRHRIKLTKIIIKAHCEKYRGKLNSLSSSRMISLGSTLMANTQVKAAISVGGYIPLPFNLVNRSTYCLTFQS